IALTDASATANAWIPRFLDFCRQSSIPLDFVSYHRYEDARLRLDMQDGLLVRGWLNARGMNNVEIINTEWNIASYDGPVTPGVEAMFGAGIPARVLSMSSGTVNRSVHFSAPDAPEELILPTERVRPMYNVFRMLDTLKGVSVSATSDGLDSNGLG